MMPTATRTPISEALPSGASPVAAGTSPSKRQITIITAGWGSSGYYSRELLARDGPQAWPAGTHMYLNHPSESEEYDRPERDLRDLVGVTLTDPVMQGDALVCQAEVYEHWIPVINAMADDIGVSIRAYGDWEQGEAEGRTGRVFTSIIEGVSVDYVTRAGRGGKVGPMLESAREAASGLPPVSSRIEEVRNAANWLEARIHSDFTDTADYLFGQGYVTREERVALSSAIGDALDAFNSSVQTNLPQLLQRDPYEDPAETGVSVDEGAPAPNQPKEEPGMGDTDRLAELEEAQRQQTSRIEALESERDEAKTRAERAEERADLAEARVVVNEALTAEQPEGQDALPELPDKATQRVRESVLRKLPRTDEGALDKDKLREAVVAAVREEADYLGLASEAGKVRGMGARAEENGGSAGNGTQPAASEAEKEQLKKELMRSGLSEEAATTAAEGR